MAEDGPELSGEIPPTAYRSSPTKSQDEEAIRAVFMAAKQFTERVGLALREWTADTSKADPSSVTTVRNLEVSARVHYACVCSLLFEDWLSYGTDAHVRSLIEILVNANWLSASGGLVSKYSFEARARCYELALARGYREDIELQNDLAKAKGFVVPQDQLVNVDRAGARVSALTLAHEDDRCNCQGNGNGFWRTERHIQVLNNAKPPDRLAIADGLELLWKVSSRHLHYGGVERMLRSDGEKAWIGPAEIGQRLTTFVWATELYKWILAAVVTFYSDDVAQSLVNELTDISLAEPILKNVAVPHTRTDRV